MKHSPSIKNPPSAINPDAIRIWEGVVREHADDIYESKNSRVQWTKAKYFFEKLCRKERIEPYVDGPLTSLASRLNRIARKL